jgi:hypothetical protein
VGVRRCKEQRLITVEEIPARRLSRAIRDAAQIGATRAHYILLITRAPIARGLKREPLTVVAEVRLGILATVRETPDVHEVGLAGLAGNANGNCVALAIGNARRIRRRRVAPVYERRHDESRGGAKSLSRHAG